MVEIFVVHSQDCRLKVFLFISQNLYSLLSTGVQIYLTSACKIFGVARKRRVPAEKCSYRSIKKANTFKAKRRVEKRGTSYLNQVPWSPQQTIPDLRLYLSIQLQKFLSRTYSRFLHMSLCAWICVCVCVCVCVCEWMSQCVSVCVSLCEWVCL